MSKSWHQTENDIEAKAQTNDFWSTHSEQIQIGQFWAERIKKLRGQPVERLKLAIENLPLPASFREASVALRTIIKSKIKTKEKYEDELALLYWLASINSFSIPYSEVLKQPGYNVIESIPGKKLKELPFSYNELGYKELMLLNKTDVKWFILAWGEPTAHTTLHDIHIDIWREYENKLKINGALSSNLLKNI